MPHLRCPHCLKQLSSLSGFSRHKCKSASVQNVRRKPSTRHVSLQPPETCEAEPSTFDDNVIATTSEDIPVSPIAYPAVEYEEVDETEAYPPATCARPAPDSDADVGDETDSTAYDNTHEELESSNATEATFLEFFVYNDQDSGEGEGTQAGRALTQEEVEELEPEERPVEIATTSDDDVYSSFASVTDWQLTMWFHSAGVSKGKIQEWFAHDNFHMPSRSKEGSLTSYTDLTHTIYRIPYGIPGGDQWSSDNIHITSQATGNKGEDHPLIYRPIKSCLEFLLGHGPFAPDMVWGPVRKSYGQGQSRVYDEMHTGTWWWERQKTLPPGATLVPVILATDKTLMTNLGGDRVVWPIYLQIGNHKRHLRRQQQVPATILLGMLPISTVISRKTDDGLAAELKSALYHQSMLQVLDGMKELTERGWFVRCADGQVRHCFPILGPMCIDHEEVCLVYGIKHNRQCARCEVEYSHLQDLTATWPKRTEPSMYRRIQTQERLGTKREDPQWVHPIEPFFWQHWRSDMHENVVVDMLHGLQKGVFRNLVDMSLHLVKDLYHDTAPRSLQGPSKRSRSLKQSPGLVQLDARFNSVPRYQGLKHFRKFTQVTQWTGGEERDLLRVWMAVLTPLLIQKAPMQLAYTRALVDFILIAQYRTHDEATLQYLQAALYRVDALKSAFNSYRPSQREEANWNTPKFHMLSHYVEFIRLFGAPNGFDTEHLEAPHKFLLKQFYDRTNKNDEYLAQIAGHNTRDNNLKAMSHRIQHHLCISSSVDVEVPVQVTRATVTPLKPTLFNCPDLDMQTLILHRSLRHPSFRPKLTTSAGCAAIGTGLNGFLEALAKFVLEERQRAAGETVVYDYTHTCPGDTSWLLKYPLVFLSGLRCWKRSGTNEENSEAMEEEILRCNPDWRRKGGRGDFCWVQAYPRSSLDALSGGQQPNPWNGTRVGQLRVIVAILDIGSKCTLEQYPTYYGAMVDVYPFQGQTANPKLWKSSLGQPDLLHGMIEATRAPVPTVPKPTRLQGRRFFRMLDIYRSAHVIPATFSEGQNLKDVFYINNYVDWDQYQTYYRDDWEQENKRQAAEFRRRHGKNSSSLN